MIPVIRIAGMANSVSILGLFRETPREAASYLRGRALVNPIRSGEDMQGVHDHSSRTQRTVVASPLL